MNTRSVLLSAVVITALGLLEAPPPPGGDAVLSDYREVVSFDVGVERSRAPLPTDESVRFNYYNPVIRWAPSKSAVDYLVFGQPDGVSAQAANSAVATVDQYVPTRRFTNRASSNQRNPCTGEPNSISWAKGDGPGGLLAMAGVCFNTRTNEIAGFRVVIDSTEDWSTTGAPDKFDVESVLAHEMGHVAGLEHVNGRTNALLTMYPYTALGETHKRTLANGDVSGLGALYDERGHAVGGRKASVLGDMRSKKEQYAETGGPNLFWD